MPQMSACIGSMVLALASITNRPASRARAIQVLSSSGLRMVWYLARSNGRLRAASLRASASNIGEPLGLDALSSLPPLPSFACAGALGANRSPDVPDDWALAGAVAPALPLLVAASASTSDGLTSE